MARSKNLFCMVDLKNLVIVSWGTDKASAWDAALWSMTDEGIDEAIAEETAAGFRMCTLEMGAFDRIFGGRDRRAHETALARGIVTIRNGRTVTLA